MKEGSEKIPIECPNCNSHEIEKSEFGLLSKDVTLHYVCKTCGHRWKITLLED